jgi:hypothetical protein
MIIEHFNKWMDRRAILVWDCGDGGDQYSIRIRKGFTDHKGFRETVGPITVTSDRLQIASYTALTMAAQFSDEPLPSRHEQQWAIPLQAGHYKIRIVQTFDPRRIAETEAPHFIIEIEDGDAPGWRSPAWIQT